MLSLGLGPPFPAGTLPGAFAQGEEPVANRRFEMFEVRQVLTRMWSGDTDRAIARAGLMGRRKLAQLRRTAEAAGWLEVATHLPGVPELAVYLGPVRTQPAVASLAEPHRERIECWWRQGIQGTTIHGALVRNHGFTGSWTCRCRIAEHGVLVDIDARTCDESSTLAAAHWDVDPVHAPCPATRLMGRGTTVAPRPSLHARPSARFEERVQRAPRGHSAVPVSPRAAGQFWRSALR